MQDNYMEDSKELDPTEPENTVDPDEQPTSLEDVKFKQIHAE